MFFRLFKFLLSFTISFLILSIPVGNNNLFSILHYNLKPVAQKVYDIGFKNIIEQGRESISYTKDIITSDSLSSIQSSTTSSPSKENSREIEKILKREGKNITEQEKEKLKKILQKSF